MIWFDSFPITAPSVRLLFLDNSRYFIAIVLISRLQHLFQKLRGVLVVSDNVRVHDLVRLLELGHNVRVLLQKGADYVRTLGLPLIAIIAQNIRTAQSARLFLKNLLVRSLQRQQRAKLARHFSLISVQIIMVV